MQTSEAVFWRGAPLAYQSTGWDRARRAWGRYPYSDLEPKRTLNFLCSALTFSWPAAFRGGRTVDTVTSTVDIFPTLLDFAGVGPLEQRSGKSLRLVIEGKEADLRERVIGATNVGRLPPGTREELGNRGSFVPSLYLRDATWHYVWAPTVHQDWLFNIRADPWENNDLSGQERERVQEFRRLMLAWEKDHSGPVQPDPRRRVGN